MGCGSRKDALARLWVPVMGSLKPVAGLGIREGTGVRSPSRDKSMRPAHLIVYSDYLCPWCYNATVRLERVEQEFGADLRLEWRSYLLRPRPDPRRTLENFRAYTQSWLRPAAEEDGGAFTVWSTDFGPPSHSVPPQIVAKAAAGLGGEYFRRMHRRLLEAYFGENRDITATETLRQLWRECGLPDSEFGRVDDPVLVQAVLAEHNEAVELGINGVPSVRAADNDTAVTGAHPVELYRRWVKKLLAAE